MIKSIIQSTVFLLVSLSAAAYVAMELDQFNEALTKSMVYSYSRGAGMEARNAIKGQTPRRQLALSAPISK